MDAIAQLGVSPETLISMSGVLLVAGFVSGLSGFAFAAAAAGLNWILPPLQAVPLILLMSTSNQLLSAGTLWRDMRMLPHGDTECALPFIIGGAFGVPVGLLILSSLPAAMMCAALGGFLVCYGAFLLCRPSGLRLSVAGWKPAIAAGAAGGVVGGFSGFPSSFPLLYLTLRGMGRSEMRGIVQPFIVIMQIFSFLGLAIAHPGLFNRQFAALTVVGLPFALAGTSSGVATYRAMSDASFRTAVLLLLVLSGASLLMKPWLA